MQLPKLEPNSKEFDPNIFGRVSDIRNCLGCGSYPVAVLVTCSELGFEPDLLAGANDGELVIVQTVGGLVVAPGQKPNSQDAFAERLMEPTIQHLILCGHSQCLIYHRLLNDIKGHRDLLLYPFVEPTVNRMQSVYGDRSPDELYQLMIQESVLQQADLVQQRPDASQRLRDGTLKLHIWIRDDETAKIAAFDPSISQFQ